MSVKCAHETTQLPLMYNDDDLLQLITVCGRVHVCMYTLLCMSVLQYLSEQFVHTTQERAYTSLGT